MTTDTPTTTDPFLAEPSRRLEPASGLDMPLCLDRNADARRLGVVIAAEAQRIARHESEARLGVDPDGVHQLRVAGRRLRCRPPHSSATSLDHEWVGVMRAELRWLGAELGHVRDLEVMRDVLSACAASLPAADVGSLEPLFLNASRTTTPRAHDMLLHARRPALRGAPASARLRDQAPFVRQRAGWRGEAIPIAALSWKRAPDLAQSRRARRPHPTTPCAARGAHPGQALPVRGRAREPGDRPRRATISRALARVQDVLGEQHDAVVAAGWLAQGRSPNVHRRRPSRWACSRRLRAERSR